MDIVYRLRIIFWFLILIIWGIYLYQYLSQDLEKEKKTKIILNKSKRETKIQKKNISSYQQIIPQTNIHIQTYENLEKENNTINPKLPIIMPNQKEIIDISLPQDHTKDDIQNNKINLTSKQNTITEKIEVPDGFNFKETRHFYLYTEKEIDIEETEKEVEYLHGEIMIDLIAFSPWTRDEKVHIYLTNNSLKYQQLSGRPAWSGGAANLKERKIYLYKSHEWKGILAHELTHIYFDSFFGGYDKSPLWLSEGMAVYIQIQRGGSKPLWLKENIEKLASGNFYRLKDIVETKTLDDINEKNIKLWYAQCYTIIYLLIKIQQKDEFYQFCKLIKEGNSISKSLFLAYGKPYTTLAALESIWKFEIKNILEKTKT